MKFDVVYIPKVETSSYRICLVMAIASSADAKSTSYLAAEKDSVIKQALSKEVSANVSVDLAIQFSDKVSGYLNFDRTLQATLKDNSTVDININTQVLNASDASQMFALLSQQSSFTNLTDDSQVVRSYLLFSVPKNLGEVQNLNGIRQLPFNRVFRW